LGGSSLLGTGTERRDIDADKVSSLQVAADSAEVVVLGEAGLTQVSVVPIVVGAPDDIHVVVVLSGSGDLAIAASNGGDPGALRLKVLTPPGIRYQVAVDSGNVKMHGMEVGGQVAVSNGDVKLALVPTTELQVAVEKGNILVELPPDTNTDLKAATDEGTITVEDFTFHGDNAQRALDGRLNEGGEPGVELATDKGDIVIRAHVHQESADTAATDAGN
jgi:hypothetical protein